MAKRKQQNLEIERQLQKRKQIFQVIALAVVALLVVIVCVNIWIIRDRRWVMSYDGGRVATSDFRAVFDLEMQGSPDPAARAAALGSLQQIIALIDRAEYHGVALTPEEREEAEEGMDAWRQFERQNWGFDIMGYISNARLAELFTTGPLVQRLIDIYVPVESVDVDEAEFAELFEEYIAENIYNHMNMQVLILDTFTLEDIEEAYALVDTMDFEDIVMQFVEGFGDEEEEVMPEPMPIMNLLGHLDDMGLSSEDREHLLYLEAGEVSRIIAFYEDGEPIFYLLVKMVSREEPDLDAVEADFRSDYIDERRHERFVELVEQWTEEANFVVNERGYNSV